MVHTSHSISAKIFFIFFSLTELWADQSRRWNGEKKTNKRWSLTFLQLVKYLPKVVNEGRFFSHKKNNTQSMIVGDWKTTRFAWNTFHQWPKINNRWLRVIKKQLVLHKIFSNNGDQSMFFWQRKNNQTINDCGWLKTCSPCMEYLRLIVIKWCFFWWKRICFGSA